MKYLTLDQIKELAQQAANPSISIFLPTHRTGQDIQQDAIRLKNLLRDAERQLLNSGMGPREVTALLQPAQALHNDSYFWRHQYDGLAVFMAADDFHSYRLPFCVEELLIIAPSYYVKPMLPLFTNNGHYYILALSQNEVRLFEGTRHSVGQIDLPAEIPTSLNEALKLDEPEKQLQMHTRSSPGTAGRGMFHGQGSGAEEQEAGIEHYLSLVDSGLKDIFRDQQAPLVLAGVDYLLPIYRRVSDYAHIMPEGISGNPEHLLPKALQEQAWPIVEPHFRQEMEKIMMQYQQFAGTDKAEDNIEKIVAAAVNGRVDRLVLAVGTQVWGLFNRDTGKVVYYQEGQSRNDHFPLIDFAAMQTLQNGGTVYALSQDEMPTKSPVAAVFRY
jgi:hypothetical protein